MVGVGQRMARNARGTHGHGRRVRNTTTTTEPLRLEDIPWIEIIPDRVIPRTTTQPESMEDVQVSPQQSVPRTRTEPIRLEDAPGVQVIVHQPASETGSTSGNGNTGSSSAGAGESGIDPTMAEIRDRQWEELRRRLASRIQRRE